MLILVVLIDLIDYLLGDLVLVLVCGVILFCVNEIKKKKKKEINKGGQAT
jgi:hypothetical protein